MNILVTGGAGYIGSHTCVELLNQGHNIIIFDNLSNSEKTTIKQIEKITNKTVYFYKMDLLDYFGIKTLFRIHKIDLVIHFAGLKAVGESVEKPLMYYENNITGTLNLLKAMKKENIKSIIFSSSANVYKQKNKQLKETSEIGPTNPYGKTKLMIEYILKDVYKSDNEWSIVLLRYFNPVGSHESGSIGENPRGIPNNLFPFINKVATKEYKQLNIYGSDYNTKDGTGVRDYIHVVDLAKGHIKSINKLKEKGVFTYNLGTGKGYSVLEVVKMYEKYNNVKINYKLCDRRKGDVDCCFADSSKANTELNWYTEKTIKDMCIDSFNWENKK